MNNKNPSIAVVMTGLPRFGEDTDTLILNLQNYDFVDYYIAFWRHNPLTMSAFNTRWQTLSEEDMIKEIQSRLPERHTIKSFSWVDESSVDPMPKDYPAFYSNPYNTWQQYQILKWQWERTPVNDYDLIVRGRADAGMDRPVDLLSLYQTTDTTTLVMPDNQRQGQFQFCDHMAIGRSQAIEHLAKVVDHFDSTYSQGCPFNAELLLGVVLSKQGLQWPQSGWNSTLKTHGTFDEKGTFHQTPGRWELI
jgi:hypothetical protein